MVSSVIDILRKGVDPDTGTLKENGFAKRLLEEIINGKKVPNIVELLADVHKEEIPESFDYPDVSNGLDRRIKWLLLKNVRQYSPNQNNAQIEIDYYGVNFCSDEKVASSIFLGANGSGKTSLFSSLEYLYKGYSDIASSHGKSNDQTGFLRSVGENPNDWEIKAILQREEEQTENKLSGFELGAPFCSECDYYEITRDWDRVDKYIAYQLGYGELWLLRELLSKLKKLFAIAKKYRDNKNLIYIKENQINNSDLDDKEKSDISIEIQSLSQSADQIMNSFLIERGVDINLDIDRFITKDNSDLLSEESIGELYSTLNYLEDKWFEIIDNFKPVISPIMEKMMRGHLLKSYESIDISIREKRLKMDLIVHVEDEKHYLSPVEYFNTFRLKLFCLAIKMALYCSVKIIQGINLPFIIDDIFDSSDFHNRTTINSFIWHMLEAHDQIINEAVRNHNLANTLPIQIIFFTQDNLIAENVYRGLWEYIFEEHKEAEMGAKYGRLFRPADFDLEKKDKDKIISLAVNGNVVKVLEVADCYPGLFYSDNEDKG